MLLVAGLGSGTVAALVAVAPHLLAAHMQLPVGSLALMLGLVLVAGIASGLAGVVATLRTALLPALRAE
jgi:hypothetical protein